MQGAPENERPMFQRSVAMNVSLASQYAIIAQLVEQAICNRQVVGSSPSGGSTALPAKAGRKETYVELALWAAR